MTTAVDVRNLCIGLTGRDAQVVNDVSFTIEAGEVLGLVGESGSGKTTVSTALLGYCRRGAIKTGGEVTIVGQDIGGLTPAALQHLRGSVVAYVPQDPSTALNPAIRIGAQIAEVLRRHLPDQSEHERSDRIASVLSEVALPSDKQFLRRFPHQLSGGQQQRVAIAIAFACRPKVIVCDEPTTGLDVTTQAQVLETIRDLCGAHQVAALYVSHDLAVVATLAHRVAVMYAGRIIEVGTYDEIFSRPRHPYTRKLLLAAPRMDVRHALEGIPGAAPSVSARPDGCEFAPRCPITTPECRSPGPVTTLISETHSIRCLHHDEPWRGSSRQQPGPRVTDDCAPHAAALLRVSDLYASYGDREVLHGIDIEVRSGECLALVGESGSGKTTLSRCIGGLHSQYEGVISFDGAPLAAKPQDRAKSNRKDIQYIFQNPYGALNPRRSIGRTLARQLKLFSKVERSRVDARLSELLDLVALPKRLVGAYPAELSGGERQRVAIARALAAEPRLLVCDEITSALDVSVQAAIVETLRNLQAEVGVSLLFVTHNLALTRTIADRVAVMRDGHIVEQGGVEDVFASSTSSYTKELLRHTPSLSSTPDVGVDRVR